MSFWDEDLFTLDNLLHVVAGAAMAACVMWSLFMIPVVWVIWGLLREKAQSDKGWFEFWSVHKALEGAAWGVGATIPVVIYYVV